MSVTVDVDAGGAVTVDVDENAGGPAGGVLSGNYPDPGFAVPMATEADLTAHEAAHPAHPASGVSVVSGAGVTATDVQAAIAQIVGFITSQEAGDSAAIAAVAAGLADEITRATAQELLKLAKNANLSDLANAATARTNLGLGSAATHPATDFDAAGAAAAAQAASIPLTQKGAASGVASLDGSGLVPDTQIPAGIARDTEVASAVAALVASAPATLDTLNELATALGDDPNFATTMAAALGNRLLWRGAWAATTAYAINDLVTFNGGLFRAPTAFTSGASFNQANWIVLVPQTGTYAPGEKTPTNTTEFWRADGTWAAPAGGGGSGVTAGSWTPIADLSTTDAVPLVDSGAIVWDNITLAAGVVLSPDGTTVIAPTPGLFVVKAEIDWFGTAEMGGWRSLMATGVNDGLNYTVTGERKDAVSGDDSSTDVHLHQILIPVGLGTYGDDTGAPIQIAPLSNPELGTQPGYPYLTIWQLLTIPAV